MPPPSLPPPQDETSRFPRLAEVPAPPDQTTALDWHAIEKPQSSARGTPARQLPRPAWVAKPVEIRAAAPARWSTRAVAPDAEPNRAPGSIVRAQPSEMPPSPPLRPWRGPDAPSPTPPAPQYSRSPPSKYLCQPSHHFVKRRLRQPRIRILPNFMARESQNGARGR